MFISIICALVLAFIAFVVMMNYYDTKERKKTGLCIKCDAPIDIWLTFPEHLCDNCKEATD